MSMPLSENPQERAAVCDNVCKNPIHVKDIIINVTTNHLNDMIAYSMPLIPAASKLGEGLKHQ